jgi:hypothetical protein
MDSVTIYPYSKKNSIVTIIVMLILGVLFISNVYKAYNINDRFDLIVFAIFIIVLVGVLTIVVFRRLMPSLHNDAILEFNEICLVDHLRNITINWEDIESIGFRRTRSSSLIVIHLKWESDYGKDISISLRWVAGKDLEIYNTALAYFDSLATPQALDDN